MGQGSQLTAPPTDKIEENLARYTELITSIRELDYVTDALPLATAELEDNKLRLKKRKTDLKTMERQQADAYQAWQDIKGSKATRLKVKLLHRQEGLAAEMLAREHNYELLFSEGQSCLAELKEQEARVDNLEATASSLRALATRHVELQGELSVLYDTVFNGPTPGYPEEDEAEDAVAAAKYGLEEVESCLTHETEVLNQFKPLVEYIERAERQFRKAQRTRHNENKSRYYHHKQKAQDNYYQARAVEHQIRTMKPSIPQFPGSLPESGFWNSAIRERKHYCRNMVQHVLYHQGCTSQEVLRLTDEVKAARAELSSREMSLKALRNSIMSERAGLPTTLQSGSARPPAYS